MNGVIDKRPSIGMHLVGRADGKGPRHIVMTQRPWRSKYVTLVCFCKRRRKDGSCVRTDHLASLLIHPERAWIQHPEMDDVRFRVCARGETE